MNKCFRLHSLPYLWTDIGSPDSAAVAHALLNGSEPLDCHSIPDKDRSETNNVNKRNKIKEPSY